MLLRRSACLNYILYANNKHDQEMNCQRFEWEFVWHTYIHTHTKHIQKQYKFLLAHFCLSNKFWNVSHLFGKFSSSLSRKETIFRDSYIHLITFIIPKTSSIYTKYFTVRYFQLWQLSFKIYLILHVKIILIIIMMIKIKENFVACFL